MRKGRLVMNTRINSFLLLAICIIWMGLPSFAHAKGEPAGEIGVREAAALIKQNPGDLLVIDVRTPAEFRQGHIPNARNMDFFGGKFDMEAAALPKDKTILLYCRSGKRSAGAAETLREAGIRKILHMQQGMEAWEQAGLPVEK